MGIAPVDLTNAYKCNCTKERVSTPGIGRIVHGSFVDTLQQCIHLFIVSTVPRTNGRMWRPLIFPKQMIFKCHSRRIKKVTDLTCDVILPSHVVGHLIWIIKLNKCPTICSSPVFWQSPQSAMFLFCFFILFWPLKKKKKKATMVVKTVWPGGFCNVQTKKIK